MGLTAEGNTWRLRHDLTQSLGETIDALCQAEPVVEDATAQPPCCAGKIRAVLSSDFCCFLRA
jgi:hypothetical protein